MTVRSGARGVSRRRFLEGASAALAMGLLAPARRALALGDASRFTIAEMIIAGGTTSRSRAWSRLLHELVQTTSVEAVTSSVQVTPEDPLLFDHPFSVMVGSGPLGPISEEGEARLARYLSYGGFLFVDDASMVADSAFDSDLRRLVARIMPTRPMAPLPADHSLYRAFFLIERPLGRTDRVPYLEGITVGDVTPLVYCRNDLSGALDRRDDGRDRHPVVPGGAAQRREALKLGINLVLYALTSNYKKDITHVKELMRDGRL